MCSQPDSGDFAFFSCRQVINLDGLANNMQYQRAIADRRINQYLRSNHVRYLVQHAVHGHDDVVQGSYESLGLNFPSRKFGVPSDDVLVYRQNEAYRSPPYFDGADRVVLLSGRCERASSPPNEGTRDACDGRIARHCMRLWAPPLVSSAISRKFRTAEPEFPLDCWASVVNHSAISKRGAGDMSKGIDRKKETKKKPALNLMQKRAAKAEKKKNK